MKKPRERLLAGLCFVFGVGQITDFAIATSA